MKHKANASQPGRAHGTGNEDEQGGPISSRPAQVAISLQQIATWKGSSPSAMQRMPGRSFVSLPFFLKQL